MSLRLRLNLLITLLLLIFMIAVGVITFKGTKSSIKESVESATRVTVQLLDTVIVSSTQNVEWGYTHDVMQRFLQHLGHVRSNNIYLYDISDNLIYKSPPSKFQTKENPPQWFIDLLKPNEESVTRFIRYGKLIVQPDPLGAIREVWGKMRNLFIIGLCFFILLNTIVYWMLGRWLRPLQPILQAINNMEKSDLSARLPHFDLPEFEKIGHSLNRMAESLAAERQLEENRQVTGLIQKHIEDERRSLARELHDELGQYVTAIKTFAIGIANKAKINSSSNLQDIESHAKTIVAAANHIYDGMHGIIRQLRPGSLDNLGLSATLRDTIQKLETQHPHIRFTINLSGEIDELGETININIYRIVQESINNAIKHANANKIDCSLNLSNDSVLQLRIKDNGCGMNLDEVDQTSHFGLLGMRERIQGLHGDFKILSEPNQGTTICIDIAHISSTQ